MKSRNYYVYDNDINRLNRLSEDYAFIGRKSYVDLDNRCLVVLALEPKPPTPRRARPTPKDDR